LSIIMIEFLKSVLSNRKKDLSADRKQVLSFTTAFLRKQSGKLVLADQLDAVFGQHLSRLVVIAHP